MLLHFFFTAAGLIVLLVTADWLIDGAERLACRVGAPPAVIGLTVVAFGTSLPELIVAARATVDGLGGLALGNVIGSNIANVLFVLGAVGLITPFRLKLERYYSALSILIVSTLAFTAVMTAGWLFFSIGAAAWLFLFAYVMFQARTPSIEDENKSEVASDAGLLRIAMGIVGVAIGAELLVSNAEAITVQYGLRDELIGLTIIAIGTSLPELATVHASIRRNDPEMALGNIIGSNIFNILAVGGVVGLLGGASLSAAGKLIDLPVMLAATVLLVVLIWRRQQLSRAMSCLLLLLFAGYLLAIGATATG